MEVDIQSNTGGVEIAIRDQGIGIPARDQERVFERFYRVGADRSRETGGAGLGLSICKMIVELHGGRIWLWSEVEAGTSVCVVLPISNATRGEM